MGHMMDGLLPMIDGLSLDVDGFKSHRYKVDRYKGHMAPTWL